jgi:hypothetical protein
MRSVVRFMITMPPMPIHMNTLFFTPIPGRMAKEMKMPPMSPPICAMKSIELPIEKSREMKMMKAIMHAMVDLMGPNLSSSVQLIIKNAINPPNIPKMAVDAPTVTLLGLHSTLSVNP